MDTLPQTSSPQIPPSLNYQTVHPLRPIRPLAIGLITLLSISLLGVVITATYNALLAHLWQEYIDKKAALPLEISVVNLLAPIAPYTMIPPMIPAFIALLAWMHQSNKKLRSTFRERLRFSPAQTIGFWFLPFVCLIKPFEVMKELYAASRGTPRNQFTPIIGIWWATWLAGSLLWQIANVAGSSRDTGDTVEQVYVAYATWHVLPAPLFIIAGILLIRIVYVVDRSQERRRSRLTNNV